MLFKILFAVAVVMTVAASTSKADVVLDHEALIVDADVQNGDQIRAAAPCVLKIVAGLMNKVIPDAFVMPKIRMQHEVSLTEFQNAVEPGWNFRPDVFTNVYTPASDQVFLISEKRFYRAPRNVFDSLAHELAHVVQVKIMGIPLEWFGDSEEGNAVDAQTQFREKYSSFITPDGFQCPID